MAIQTIGQVGKVVEALYAKVNTFNNPQVIVFL